MSADTTPATQSTPASTENAPIDLSKTLLDVNEIMKIIPHRFPMLMIDRVVSIDAMKKIVCVKNVSANEPFFQGHFPAEPIMPGVLILEALAQASCVLVLRGLNIPGCISLFTGVEEVSWRRKVVPGDTLRLEAEVEKLRLPFGRVKAAAYVGKDLACEATVKFMIQMPEKKSS